MKDQATERGKAHLYSPLKRRQENLCACECGDELHPKERDNHIDRIEEGGSYELDNTRVVRWECHRRLHRQDTKPRFPELREVYEDYRYWLKTRMKAEQMLRGARASVFTSQITLEGASWMLDRAEDQEKYFEKKIAEVLKQVRHPIVKAMQNLNGTGSKTVAMLLARVDISKAEYPSSLHKFFGYAGPSSDRYKKGTTGGGSKQDRSALHQWASSQIKLRTPYRKFYDKRRERTNGEDKWRSDAHRMADAMRVMIKMFLSHFHEVYRKMEGFPAPAPYPINHLGHDGYVSPAEMGWE